MNTSVFTIKDLCRPQRGMTVSRNARISDTYPVTYYALAQNTDISAEYYDTDSLYIAAAGSGELYLPDLDPAAVSMRPGDCVLVPGGKACGKRTDNQDGFVYTEILLKGEHTMNEVVTPGKVFALKDLVQYQEDGIANLDLVGEDDVKFMVLAFDDGTALPEHRAPGDAIVFALEGKAVIGYEGQKYPIKAGENFRFAKNGLHSVTADGKFKMALLLIKK